MKNIIFKFNQLIAKIKPKTRKLLVVSVLATALIASSFSLADFVQAKNETETDLVFDKTQALPIVLTEKKIEVQRGLAKADIDKLNNERDPEAIKAYIQQLGAEKNVDWKLVYAIGVYESGNFKSSLAQNNNNFFGRKATSTTWMKWNTPQEGIDNQFEYLKTRYIDKGMDTPAEMNRVYCEGNTWQYKVQSIMDAA